MIAEASVALRPDEVRRAGGLDGVLARVEGPRESPRRVTVGLRCGDVAAAACIGERA